jgi:hypothetical protein
MSLKNEMSTTQTVCLTVLTIAILLAGIALIWHGDGIWVAGFALVCFLIFTL